MVKFLPTALIVLVALIALMAMACGGDDPEPTPEPAPTATPPPTPTPPTPTPEPTPVPEADAAPGAPAMTFTVPDYSAETTGMEVAEALFSEEEMSCIQSALGPEASAALLTANVLDPAAQGSTAVFGECLTQENSVTLFLAGFKAATGDTLNDETLNCIGNAVAPHHAVLFAEELSPEVMFSFLSCLSPEQMAAMQAGLAAQQ